MNTIEDLWKIVLKDLEEDLSAISIATWFDEVSPVRMELTNLYLYCPNSFKRTSIESFYMEPMRKILRRRFSNDIQILFISDEEYELFAQRRSRRRPFREKGKFTFETFVVGDSNRTAYNAAQAVAAGFDEYCNPLVIYGNPGLGKTHLLQAIAVAVNAADPNAEVVCVKGDEFTNELVGAIREDTNAQFRDKYRNAAVFLMDDVQFIAGKRQTQEEFFNTFETLYQNGCSIVVTMDRPPRELGKLEERIISRFEGGLMVEIGEPEYNTRLEIIKQKAAERGLKISSDDIEYIANQVTGSIRQIEGVLNKLKIVAEPDGATSCVRTVVDGMAVSKPRITPDEVLERVSRHYNVDPNLIKGKGRTKQVMLARQITMYVLCNGLGLTTTQVGTIMKRDHSTVCYALQSVERKMGIDETLSKTINSLM